ncbi:hypothetical protein MNBD_GAMMA16-913 [hydrothermal vent metagenome]|uniref:Uncharacterized protein n=1 Tax=hydrothermal vent metagenome TaxID=652676 RepID=A0A3B0ZXM2_9ZZZZ
MPRSGSVTLLLLLLTLSYSALSAPLVSELGKYNFYANTKDTKKGPNLNAGLKRSNDFGLYINSKAEFKSEIYKHSLSTGLRRAIGSTDNTLSFTATTSDYFDLASTKKTVEFSSVFKKLKARYILKKKSIIQEAEGRFSLLGASLISTFGESRSRIRSADKTYFVKMNTQYRIIDLTGKISTTSSRVDTLYSFKSLTQRRFGWALRGDLHVTNTPDWDSQVFKANLNMQQVSLHVSYKQKLQRNLQRKKSGFVKINREMGKLNLALEVEFANGGYKDVKLAMMLPEIKFD